MAKPDLCGAGERADGSSRAAHRAVAAALALLLAMVGRGLAQEPVVPAETRPSATAPTQATTALLYFFSPDWRPADLGRLTVAMEEALGHGGVPVTFQAFTRYEDFERQLLENNPSFVIAPAWIGDSAPGLSGLGLHVIARPLRRGKSTYRKALMTRPGVDSIDDLARGAIAATLHSMSAGSPAAVLETFHLDAQSARVVAVPKDVDALLALSFGQVDAALVTSEQYDQLAQSNAAEASRLPLLAFSPEVPLPPLFATATADPDTARRLGQVVLALQRKPDGSGPLALLGFDGYALVPPASSTPTTPGRDARLQPARKER